MSEDGLKNLQGLFIYWFGWTIGLGSGYIVWGLQ